MRTLGVVQADAGLAERIGVRVLDVFGFVRGGVESTIGGGYEASKKHWKLLLGVMICLMVCLLLRGSSLMTSRNQITDLAIKQYFTELEIDLTDHGYRDQEMLAEEEVKTDEELGTEK